MNFVLILLFLSVFIILGTLVFCFSRYKRCPSDKVLVIYGKTQGQRPFKCIHGGASFVWPLIQNYKWLDLSPITFLTKVKDTPVIFTLAISTDVKLMEKAAVRLLNLSVQEIEELAKNIISGQLQSFSKNDEPPALNPKVYFEKITTSVKEKFNQVGLSILNLNLKDNPLTIG